MYFLLGIDDTDSTSSKHTPEMALDLGWRLETRSLARLINLSCHQLFQHPSIPHTTNNVACCLLLDAEPTKAREIEMACRATLHHESASGSNAGFALASWNQYDLEVVAWGKTAKFTPLNRTDAFTLTRRLGIAMAGILGTGAGVIGALAAVGLRFEGNDGWIEWMPGLEGLHGIYTQSQLSPFVHFDKIESDHHKKPALEDRIQINRIVKPRLLEGKIVLIVSIAKKGSDYEWQA